MASLLVRVVRLYGVSVTLYASDMLSIRDSLVEIDARDDAVSNYRAYRRPMSMRSQIYDCQ